MEYLTKENVEIIKTYIEDIILKHISAQNKVAGVTVSKDDTYFLLDKFEKLDIGNSEELNVKFKA